MNDRDDTLTRPAPPAETPRRPAAWLLLCVAACVLVPLATRPFFPCGFADDTSYTLTALSILKHGVPVYNGWAVAMLGPQAYWGATFAWLFGPGYVAVRMSTLPLAAACGGLTWTLLHDAGLTAPRAALVTLTVMLSPMALPLSASFMSDVPGLALFLATLWLGTRALRAGTTTGRVAWLVGCAAAGLGAATVRQPYLFGVLAMLGLCAVRLRGRAERAAAGVLLAGVVAGFVVLFRWYAAQRFSLTDDFWATVWVRSVDWLRAGRQVLMIALTAVLLLLPVLAAAVPAWRDVRPWVAVLAVTAGLGFTFLGVMDRRILLDVRVGTMFDPNGVAGNDMIPGSATAPWPASVLAVADVVAIVALAFCVVAAGRAVYGLRRDGGLRRAVGAMSPAILAWSVFTAVYLPVMLTRVNLGVLFDRYLLPVLPLAGYAAMAGLPRLPRLPRWRAAVGGGLLAVSAGYAVLATGVYFRQLQTRCRAEAMLAADGVDPMQVRAGFEQDAAKQIAAFGRLNDGRLKPADRLDVRINPQWEGFPASMWGFMPAVGSRYVLCGFPIPGWKAPKWSPLAYAGLLPGTTRYVYVSERPPEIGEYSAVREPPAR